MLSVIMFVCIVFGIYAFVNLDFSNVGKKVKSLVCRKVIKTQGERLMLMQKSCDVCGDKLIYLDGDDTSNLKIVSIIDPDTQNVVEKRCCDDCYSKIRKMVDDNNKDGELVLSGDIQKLLKGVKKYM